MLRLACLTALFLTASAFAQDPASLPRFEVASIKLNTSGDGGSSNDLGRSTVVFRNYTLRGVMQTAFSVEDLSLVTPDWVYQERFDINAKVADEKATLNQRQQMLQALLFDRFRLSVHRETKMRAGFALIVSKSSPKIQPVEDAGGHNNSRSAGKLERLRTPISSFADDLALILRQPVIDETHMQGVYDVRLTFSPESGPNAPRIADNRPSIYTALEEQLGLKLEPRKVPVDILVVDHCEKMPTEN